MIEETKLEASALAAAIEKIEALPRYGFEGKPGHWLKESDVKLALLAGVSGDTT